MMRILHSFAPAILAVIATASFPVKPAAAQDLPANITASVDSATSADQRRVHELVQRYGQLLNAGDAKAIVDLFAADGVVEWNDRPTFATRQQKIDAYDALFQIAKLAPVFVYDAIDVYGTIAIVRTHHPVGAEVIVNGQSVPDHNREVFVLRKQADDWKIIVYTFNTNPIQGQG